MPASASHSANGYDMYQIQAVQLPQNIHLSPGNQDSAKPELNQESAHGRRASDLSAQEPPVTILANGAVKKFQKARQRKVLSCIACHHKKIKCSRDHPICVGCSKNNLECKYYANSRVSRGGKTASRVSEISPTQPKRESSMSSENSARYSHPKVENQDIFASNQNQNQNMNMNSNQTNSAPLGEMQANDWGYDNDVTSSKMSASSSLFSNTHPAADTGNSQMQPDPPFAGNALSPATNSASRGNSNSNIPVFDTRAGKNVASPEDSDAAKNFAPSYQLQNRPNSNSDSLASLSNKFLAHAESVDPLSADDALSNSMGPFAFVPSSKGSTSQMQYAPEGFVGALNLSAMNVKPTHVESADQADFFNQIKPLEQHFEFPGNLLSIQTKDLQDVHVMNPYSKNDPILSSFANFIDGNLSDKHVRQRDSHTPSLQKKEKASSQVSAQENALNACASNPATTVNFLYGTNVNYADGNISHCLSQHVPTRERSFELVNRYFSSVHVLLPIMVNVEDFLKEHTRFWSHSSHSSPDSSSGDDPASFDFLSFFTLYFPIVYAATISEFEEYDNLLLNQEIDRYLKAFNKVCQHFNYPHGLKAIPLLLGNVIIQSTSPNPSTMEMSQIIRYAKFLHLHKDPLKTLRIENWKVVRFRRKLWWVIFGLDALSSHNFCLPPVCKFSDFNVEIPEHHDPVFNEAGEVVEKVLNVSDLSMSIKCQFDHILSDLVYHLHNGLSATITESEIEDAKQKICALYAHIHSSVSRITSHYRKYPPKSVSELNLFHFVKNHSWSFADRALMLLHKKVLLADRTSNTEATQLFRRFSARRQSSPLSMGVYEDTFGHIQEENIIRNFHESPISQLRFTQKRVFAYDDLANNLIPSILHNLNDFLKYNDFIKFGKFNWYIKRTIPLDSIILLLVIMCVKFKYEYMGMTEIVIFVKLINKTLFILNKKYFKNEKYKRMLSLTNTTYEYILKKYDVARLIASDKHSQSNVCRIEFLDHQIVGVRDTSELFTIMDVPQPELSVNGRTLSPPEDYEDISFNRENISQPETMRLDDGIESGRGQAQKREDGKLHIVAQNSSNEESRDRKAEILQLNQKIYYDLRNNFVDVNDYCSFYLSLENVLHSLMDYVNDS